MLKFTQELYIWDGQSTHGVFPHETSGTEHFLTLIWGFRIVWEVFCVCPEHSG